MRGIESNERWVKRKIKTWKNQIQRKLIRFQTKKIQNGAEQNKNDRNCRFI